MSNATTLKPVPSADTDRTKCETDEKVTVWYLSGQNSNLIFISWVTILQSIVHTCDLQQQTSRITCSYRTLLCRLQFCLTTVVGNGQLQPIAEQNIQTTEICITHYNIESTKGKKSLKAVLECQYG